MLKRIISSILIIIILALWMPLQALQEVLNSVAADIEIESWTFEYTQDVQTFTVPYTGQYQIELYGAQGTEGAKGSSIIGKIKLNANEVINIYVGGKSGYNGGGAGATGTKVTATSRTFTHSCNNGNDANNGYKESSVSYQAKSYSGGGATDIRIGGTELENRVMVAGGGAGGSYPKGTCSTASNSNSQELNGTKGSATTSASWKRSTGNYACSSGGCVYNNVEMGGNWNSSSSATGGGGGGYYGGKAGYAGTSYANTTYFTETSTQVGAREGNGYAKITLLASPPEVTLSANITSNTNQNVTLTATATDNIGFPTNPYSWNGAARTSSNKYVATKNGTYTVNVINESELTTEKSYTVNNIDKLAPTINSAPQLLSADKKSTTITVKANDYSSNDYIATGVVGYKVTTENVKPSTFSSTNTFTVSENGTYYAWAKDAVGNISEARTILVPDIEIEILGNITWNDSSNKYSSRKASNIRLYRKIGTNGTETLVATQRLEPGQTEFSFQTRQCDDAGNEYIFRLEQDNIDGYETLYTGNSVSSDGTKNVEIDITNNLILPTYTSSVTIEPKDSYQNKLLKNGQAKITATVDANDSNREKIGVHNGQVILNVDSKITIDEDSIVVIYEDVNGNKTNITNYSVSGNAITTIFGNTTESISTKGSKVTIEVVGTLQSIGNYNNKVSFSGKLRDYRGTNTDINLRTITQNTNQIATQYQLPEANIQIRKVDSITEQTLTDATFTLYEWNGSEYVEKETITDANNDGIYESKAYRWNSVTQGKYKVVETGVPNYHKDLKFSIEYSLTELHTENYMVTVDYSNTNYAINYGTRNPDDLDRINGTVENEPWKLKVQIEKIDSETKNIIQSETEFTIYEWNNQTNQYEEYQSHTLGSKVNMIRQQDKTYLTGEWLYYTETNEGKYRIIETKAPEGYFANYQASGEKVTYDINILESIENGTYNNQNVENEGTIKVGNNDKNQITNERVKATLNVIVVDSETKNKAQANATIANAKYGIYAYEEIKHSDGITTRYDGEAGILYKQDELVDIQYTDELGKMTFDNLECGIYYIKMIEAPEGYILDESKYKIDFTYQGEEKSYLGLTGQIEIQVKKQAFQINKVKENLEPLENAGFSVYLISDLSIVKEGKITKVTANTYNLNDENAKQDERLKEKVNTDGTYNLEDLIDYYYKIYNGTEENAEAMPGDAYVYNPYKLTNETTAIDYSSSEQGNTITEIRTDSNGYLKSPELAYGEYIVIETSVPRAHDVTKPFIVKVQEDSREAQEIRIVIDNDFKTRVKIYKKDMETNKIILKENASYVIRNTQTNELVTKKMWDIANGYVEYGTLENAFTTSSKGYLITPMELGVGKYVLEEVKAPEGYTLNGYEGTSENGETKWEREEKLSFSIDTNTAYYTDSYLGKYIIVINQENKSVVGDIKIKAATGEYLSSIEKQDKYTFTYETRAVEGVKYKVCAKEDIYTQDNQGTLIYAKDEIVAYLTTDENGEALVENLPLGKYYIREVETVEGFALNGEQKDIEIAYEGQEVPVVFKEVATEEVRQKIEIIIHNKDAETNEIRTGGQYGLYTKTETKYTDTNGNIQTIPANEKLITLTSNEEGKIEINESINLDLPRGEYYLKEEQAPKGYILQTQTLEIDTTTQTIVDIIHIEKDFIGTQTSINIVEVNEENKITTGSTFEIKNKTTNETVRQLTTKGEVENIKKLETNVEYILVETNPSKGYTTAEEITFIIREDGTLWINGEEQEDNTITVKDYKTILQVHIKDEITKQYAQGSTWQIVQNNTVIVEWTTNGAMQQIEKLPIGEYVLKETNIGQNTGYVTNEDITFKINDTKDIQTIEVEQKVSKIEIHIKDEVTKEYAKGSTWQIVDKAGSVIREFVTNGAKYETTSIPVGSYTLKQISIGENTGYVTNEEITIVIQDTRNLQILNLEQKVSKVEIHIKDEVTKEYAEGSTWQIVKVTEDKEEVIREFETNGAKYETTSIPVGNYTLKQISIGENTGYVINEEVTFEIKDTRELQVLNLEQKVSKIEIHIKDEITKEYAKGSTWQIVDKDGKVIRKFETNGAKYETTSIPVGNYTLKQINIGENTGYVTNEEITIVIQDTRELQVINLEQKVSKIEIHIKDEVTKEYAKGSTWQIVDKAGSVIREFVTNGAKYETTSIPVGSYTLKQISIGENTGYVTNEEITIVIQDTRNLQILNLEQKVSKVEIHIKDEVTKEYAKGSTWQIVKVTEDKEEVIREFETNGAKYETTSIPVGEYILKQISTGENTGYVTNSNMNFEVIDTRELQVINLEQKISKIEIHIKEKYTEKYVEGSNWQLVKKTEDGKEIVVKQWTSNGQKYETNSVPIGEYILRQTSIGENTGYVTNEEHIIKVEDTREIQVFEIEQNVTELEIHIKDEITKEYAQGSTWQIVRNTEEKEVIREWTANGITYKTAKLPVGEYILREVSIGEDTGYVTNEDVLIKVEDTLQTQIVEVEQQVTEIEIHIKDEVTKEYAQGSTWQIVKVTEDKEEVIREFVTDGTKYETTRIPVGEYILREISAGENTGYMTNEEIKIVIQNTRELQVLDLEQKVSKLEIHIKDEITKEYTKGATWQIIKVVNNEEEIINEFTTNSEKYEINSLPVGEYILRQVDIGENTGYVTNEDILITIKDTLEVQLIEVEQKVSKIVINLQDIETEEYVVGSKLQLVSKMGENENVVREWETTEEGTLQVKLPVGKYVLKQIYTPTNEGYITIDNTEIEVKDTLDKQEVNIKQDISKLLITLEDEDTKEKIEGNDIVIKDKEGKIIASTEEKENILKIEKTENGYYIERLPVEIEYQLSEISPEGYKPIESKEISIEDVKEEQQVNLTTRKLIINIELDKQLENIIVNGEKTKAEENQIMKVEIKERKISTTTLEFEYKILITNKGEVEATLEKIVDKIPNGLICEESENPNWKISNGEAVYKESITLKPNESKEITIKMKWKNSKTNFGEIKNIAQAEGITNRYNYENENPNDSTDGISVVISVGTGLEEQVTIIRIIVIALTASMVICLFAGIEILILKKIQLR